MGCLPFLKLIWKIKTLIHIGKGGTELFDIEEELKKLPAKPGVYLMHNEQDEIIYVGKAIRLKNRVRQYFQDGDPHCQIRIHYYRLGAGSPCFRV